MRTRPFPRPATFVPSSPSPADLSGRCTISCSDCALEGTTACDDCVVSFLFSLDAAPVGPAGAVGSRVARVGITPPRLRRPRVAPGPRQVELTTSERDTLDLLQRSGLAPATQFAPRPVAASF